MKILHLEDDSNDAKLAQKLITSEWPGCEIVTCSLRKDYEAELGRAPLDLILSDYTLPGFDGMEALRLARHAASGVAFVFLSGTIGEERAISALQAGADDYVLKSHIKRLVPAMRRAMRDRVDRRQRVEADLKIKEQVDLLNKARDAMIATGRENRIQFWNRGAERLLSWTAKEAIGRDADELLGPAARLRMVAGRKIADETGEWLGEVEVVDRRGARHHLEVRLSVIGGGAGEAHGYLSICTDITEKKRLEEHLLRAQRMDNIGLLAAGIAHDLNNVLSPILMAAPILREHAADPGDIEMLTMLEKSAERGAALVRQIVTFTQGMAGTRRSLQVTHLVREIGLVVAETFPKNIRFESRMADDLPSIEASAVQIHQVVLNLCLNARDAMPRGGTLRIDAETCTLSLAESAKIQGGRPGYYVLLRVTDDGNGIAPEVLAEMWRPFFTTKAAGKGAGLGLSTVHGIMESHGGFTEVQTALGRGTSFRLYLPATSPAAGPLSAPRASRRRRGAATEKLILIVDDEEGVRGAVAAALLSRAGYRVLSAGDGAEALPFSPSAEPGNPGIGDFGYAHAGPYVAGNWRRRCGGWSPLVPIVEMSGLSRGQHRRRRRSQF